MKLEVNKDTCIGCGFCASTCPKVYDLNDDGFAYVKVDEIPKDLEEDAIDAKEGCPTGAILDKTEEE